MTRVFACAWATVAAWAVASADQVEIACSADEVWWGGTFETGEWQPFRSAGAVTNVDLAAHEAWANEPLYLSSRGQWIWSERAFACAFGDCRVVAKGPGRILSGKAGDTLREAQLHVARCVRPISGKRLPDVFFAGPQYNTWIEINRNENQRDVLRYAHAIIDNGFPAGVFMIDGGWQAAYGDWRFDSLRFPDPKAMVDELHTLGFKVMLWTFQYVAPDAPAFAKLEKSGGILTDATRAGKPLLYTWWSGTGGIVDFTTAAGAGWMRGELERLRQEFGIDGFKFDAGGPRWFDADGLSGVASGVWPEDVSAAYGRFCASFAFNESGGWRSGGQPVMARLCDKPHSWQGLASLVPCLCTAGLIGYPFVCPDMIGGGLLATFQDGRTLDQDLFVRSAQLHALSPVMQFSAAPWRVLDAAHLAAVKSAVGIRRKYSARLLALAHEAARTGEPIVRSLDYVLPGRGYADVRDQFFLGDDLMVAPQIAPGRRRTVLIPEGAWEDEDGQEYSGPRSVEIDVPLDRLPRFSRKSGTVVRLVADGRAQCAVVVAKDAPSPLRFGANEIAAGLDKVTGCGRIPVVGSEAEVPAGVCPIVIALAPGEPTEGYSVEVSLERVTITGHSPRAVLYGCFDVLSKWAGFRWLVPGEDGEYFTPRRDVVAPLGRREERPRLAVRETRGRDEQTQLWLVRNRMQAEASTVRMNGRLEELAVNGNGAPGGHILSDLLIASTKDPKARKAACDRLFAEHPEYFPLIDGVRKPIYGSRDPNPCVSNPELLDLMAANLLARLAVPHGGEAYVTIGNNDTTAWCECGNCRALDAPEATAGKGRRADRYWHMVNGIARRVWAKRPDLKLGGWAYQDFWYPPVREKVDPRLRVMVSFNNQCWRHAVSDPACDVNAEWRRIFSLWKKTGHPLVINRDEISSDGSVGSSYAPAERTLAENFRAYADYGCAGSCFCVLGPFPPVLNYAKELNRPPYYGKNLKWYGMWQTIWISAQLMWSGDGDFDALYEECNSLYYGRGWDGGFREFRKLLGEAFVRTPGCYGWGQGAPLGRCLDVPGTEERLVALLAQALEAAKDDPRATAHLLRDKEIFERTWRAARKDYLENYREHAAFRRKGEIRIDGILDEADWAAATVIDDFKPSPWAARKGLGDRIGRTRARIAYDADHLYFAVEALEPEMGEVSAGEHVDRVDGARKLGDHVKLFYNFPDMGERMFQLAINANGEIVDWIHLSPTSFDKFFTTSAEWKVRKDADRWTLEIAIPCSEIGRACFDGDVWKVNVARMRKLKSFAHSVPSSACGGNLLGSANFINLRFAGERK